MTVLQIVRNILLIQHPAPALNLGKDQLPRFFKPCFLLAYDKELLGCILHSSDVKISLLICRFKQDSTPNQSQKITVFIQKAFLWLHHGEVCMLEHSMQPLSCASETAIQMISHKAWEKTNT